MGLMAFVGFALLLAAVCGAARDASAGTGRQLGASGSRQHLEGVVAGQGDYRFRLRTDLLKLPEGVKMRNGHGLVKDPDGR